MLERTGGCLESGSLRRLLPASKSMNTRRTLHSAFWTHGACEVELSPLWQVLLRGLEVPNAAEEPMQTTFGHGGLILDFLYPAWTFNVLRHSSPWLLDRQDGRQRGLRQGLSSQRLFSSGNAGPAILRSDEEHDGAGPDEVYQTDVVDEAASLKAAMKSKVAYVRQDLDIVWREYELLNPRLRPEYLVPVVHYLSNSGQILDAERITGLYETLPESDKARLSPDTSTIIIRSFLKIHNLRRAYRVHKMISETRIGVRALSGLKEIMAYAVENSLWSEASKFWLRAQTTFIAPMGRNQKTRTYLNADVIFDEVFQELKDLPGLADRALALVDTINEMEKLHQTKRMFDLEARRTNSLQAKKEQPFAEGEVLQEPRLHSKKLKRDGEGRLSEAGLAHSSSFSNPLEQGQEQLSCLPISADETTVGGRQNITPVKQVVEKPSVRFTESDGPPSLNSSHGILRGEGALRSLQDIRKTQPEKLRSNLSTSFEARFTNGRLARLAGALVKAALLKYDITDKPKQWRLRGILRLWALDTGDDCSQLIDNLLSSDQLRLAFDIYKQEILKDRPVSYPVLSQLLDALCKGRDVEGMQEILQDYRQRRHGIPITAYARCLNEFARHGDSTIVQALFDEFAARYRITRVNDFAPLLNVYAKTGELTKAVAVFDEIETKYHMKPSILCYNILINAFGKARDFDGAFEMFESLLSTNIKPNDHTFGTLMGICAIRGDANTAMELYRLSQEHSVKESAAMIDCIVHLQCQENNLLEAEKICEAAHSTGLQGSCTRMWNYVLNAYALRADLPNVHRLLTRMSELKVESDGMTYAALLQALCMIRQGRAAWKILKEVMPAAGVEITNFHFAVIMGGHLAASEPRAMMYVYEQMLSSGISDSASTRSLLLKATVHRGEWVGSLADAASLFETVVSTLDLRETVPTARKGFRRDSPPMFYPTMFYSYMMGVLAEHKELGGVDSLYQRFVKALPGDRKVALPIPILQSLMKARLEADDHGAVAELWGVIKEQGLKDAQPSTWRQSAAQRVLEGRKYDLATSLTIYMRSLRSQKATDKLPGIVAELTEMGFALDNQNWNDYIQYLATGSQWKLAFKLCEDVLMPNWAGWQTLRSDGKRIGVRLPINVRRQKRNQKVLRPKAHVLYFLARTYQQIEIVASQSSAAAQQLKEVRHACPLVTNAIMTLPPRGTVMENSILGNNDGTSESDWRAHFWDAPKGVGYVR